MATADLTAQRLRELLHYDPETGVFTRTAPAHRGRWRAGATVGGVNAVSGYVVVGVDRCRHYAHRLAWLYMTGEWPHGEIDHINGCRTDNRISNLRDVPRQLNAQNMRNGNAASTSGLLGVTRVPSTQRRMTEKWVATIKVGGKRTYLGIFATPEEAHAAYVEAKRHLHAGGML